MTTKIARNVEVRGSNPLTAIFSCIVKFEEFASLSIVKAYASAFVNVCVSVANGKVGDNPLTAIFSCLFNIFFKMDKILFSYGR